MNAASLKHEADAVEGSRSIHHAIGSATRPSATADARAMVSSGVKSTHCVPAEQSPGLHRSKSSRPFLTQNCICGSAPASDGPMAADGQRRPEKYRVRSAPGARTAAGRPFRPPHRKAHVPDVAYAS